MKQKLILFVLAIALGVFPAVANEPLKVYLNAGNVEHLHIEENMEVVLLQAPSDKPEIMLDELFANKINFRLTNNKLTISGKENRGEKMVVYLYVSNLKSLTVDDNSRVKTLGTLETGKLDVYVDNNTTVHIRTTGSVKAHAIDDVEMQVKYLSNTQTRKRGY